MEKFESERNILFSVILDHTLNVNHLSNVILGLVPRIHAKHLLNVIFGFIPRIHSEHLSSVILGFIPRIHIKHSSLDTRVTPEYDGKRSLIKGLNVVRQCAALLERRVQSSTRVRKAQAVTRQTNPIGRSMIEMLGVLAIIGVLSVGGIQGFSKAMETYQSHKQLEQINSLIYAALELRDGLIQNYKNAPTTQRYNLMPALSALGYLPDMKLVSNHATDKYGNSFNLSFGVDGCQQPDGTVAYTCFSYRMGIYLKTQGTSFSLSSENQCKNLIKSLTAFDTENGNIGHLELRNTDTENINGYNVSSIIYGRQNCTNSRQTCFKNMTPIKMTQFCKSCASENLCELYIYFKYQ